MLFWTEDSFAEKVSKGHRTHSTILWTVYRKKNFYIMHIGRKKYKISYRWFSQRKKGLSTCSGVKITIRELRIQLTWIIAIVITDITLCDSNNLWWQIWGLLVFYGLCVHLSDGPFVICFTQVHFHFWSLLLLGLLSLLLLLIFPN